MLCTECKKIYKYSIAFRILFGSWIAGLSLYIIYQSGEGSFYFESRLISLLIGLLFFVVGAYLGFNTNKIKKNCSVCNGKKVLIKIYTPEAIEIIKKYDIPFPMDSSEEDKLPWEKN